jgi:cytochrome b involved in lipid metabolism
MSIIINTESFCISLEDSFSCERNAKENKKARIITMTKNDNLHQEWLEKVYSQTNLSEDVKRANQWIVIKDHVVDVSQFLDEHPGGSDILEDVLGTDATQVYIDVGHTDRAFEQLKEMSVGKLQKTAVSATVEEQQPSEQTTTNQASSGGWISSVTNYLFGE